MVAPKWLNRVTIDAIHLDQIREHGGLKGIDNEAALAAALERPKKRWEEEDKPDLARLAATYGHAIATDRPFRDGNTRVAFIAMAVFLELNGRIVTASEEDVLCTMITVAEGKLSRKKLAVWVRERLSPD
jgi:death-on-curing protein